MRRAGAALARLYEERGNWAELRGVTRMQSEWAEEPSERRALLARVAALEEDKLGDRGAAITTWRDVLGDAPNDAGALHALERLYQAGEKWRELVDILQRKLDTAGVAGEAVELLGRIAHIYEYRLSEADEAIAAWLDVVDRAPDDPHALSELARLYRSVGRNADLLDVLERQAQCGDRRREARVASRDRAVACPVRWHVRSTRSIAGRSCSRARPMPARPKPRSPRSKRRSTTSICD